MKKSPRLIIYIVISLLVVGVLAYFMFADRSADLTTTEFYEKMGVVFINENNKASLTPEKTATSITTSEFYKKMGVVLITEENKTQFNEPGKYVVSETEKYDVLYKTSSETPNGRAYAIIKLSQENDAIVRITVRNDSLTGYTNSGVKYTTGYGEFDSDILVAFRGLGRTVDNADASESEIVKLKYNDGGTTYDVLYDSTNVGEKPGFVIVRKPDNEYTIVKVIVDTYNLKGYNKQKLCLYKTSYGRGEYDEEILMAFQSLNGKVVDYTDPNEGSFFSSLIMPLITIGIGVLLIYIFMRQAQGGNKSAMDFGRTKARPIKDVKVRFSDVAGAEEEKQELQEIVDFLKDSNKFTTLGAKIPKGVLLVGPPGTGKTLFAKAIAGEANVPFFPISGSDFVEMFVGVGASRVRDLFAMAKQSMPCIIFIDEIDAVGRQRGAGLGGGNDEREQTLNQLLVQMDGFETNDKIIVIAATNRADILDPALLRPGRFDRQIHVHLPDVRGREAILKVHARNKPLASNVSFKILARMTAGFSGADLANLLNEAAILAARANRKAITNEDLYEAIEKVMMGPKKTSRLVTEKDKRITAYHESGHAILAKLLPNCDEVHEVTIIPRGDAGGYTLTRPENDNQFTSRNKLLDDLVMTMGGRAAEELIIKDYTTGASGDIKHASKVARVMVSELGMSEKVGPVNYGSDDQIFVGRDYQTRTNYSEALAKIIDEEVEKLIKTAHEKAVEMLSANKELLDKMARLLIERETIYSDEVNMLMNGSSVEEIMEYMDTNAEKIKNDPFGVENLSTENGDN